MRVLESAWYKLLPILMLEETLGPSAQIAVRGTKCFDVIVYEAKIFVCLLVERQVYFVYEIHLSL